MTTPDAPTWRKPAGALLIVALIVLWCVGVASLSDTIGGWRWPVQTVFYLVTGIIWIAPLKPLLRWMELGSWK